MIEVSLLQPENALLLILETELEITSDSRFVHDSKAPFPINVTESGIKTEVMLEQLVNVNEPIEVTVSGITRLVIIS